jgi:hypothetical protein
MWANVASPTNFPKRPFWQVLEFNKNGKFLASTQIRQICCRVAIAYVDVNVNQLIDQAKTLVNIKN